MPNRVWNASVVQSYSNLRNFISQSDAIDQVLSRKNKPCTRSFNPLNPNLTFTWQVCQIATSPFRCTLSVVLKIISGTAWIVGAKTVRKYAKDCARFFEIGFNVYSQQPTQIFRIKSTINDFNKEGEAVASTPAIPIAAITDPKIKKRAFFNGIKFDNNQGICRGMSEWFAYLYLNTKDHFDNPRAHMRAIGKQFVNGGGYDPALFQSISFRKGKILGLKAGIQKPRAPETPLLCFSTAHWHSNKQDMVNHLQNLLPGVYKTCVPQHATAYVKVNNNLGFFFDPNVGIIEINGPTQAEKLYELISTTQKSIGDLTGPLGFHFNYIKITPITKR